MAISPISVGDQSPLHCTFTTDSGSFSLTGLASNNFAMHYIDTSNSTMRIGTGSWSNIATNTADYNPSTADVATAGVYRLYPVLTLSTGPKAFDPQIQEILSLP